MRKFKCYPFFLPALFLLTGIQLKGQDLLLFVEDKMLLENSEIAGPLCKAFSDLDGDYRDEIIQLNNGREFHLQFNSDNGNKFKSFKGPSIEFLAWTISVGDINNDGTNELMTADSYGNTSFFKKKSGTFDFELMQAIEGDFFAQGSNFVDINNDSWLDAFICNDNGLSTVLLNDGSGMLVQENQLIDMRSSPVSDNSGNYASEWSDVDGDGDLDLYISKCRLQVESFEDPRRINMLFINESGNFREAAAEFGVDSGAQSWTGNFGDVDNDGDQDLFVSNHEFRSQLFENLDNQGFRERSFLDGGQDLMTTSYQTALHDMNNDGLLDIVIGGLEDMILINRGDFVFERLNGPFGFEDIASFALGDANRDGFTDVIASYNLLGTTGPRKDKLWVNIGNENHFIKFSLHGTTSNRNGIGSTVRVYGPWGMQSRILQSGTGYGVTHSLSVHFGLNDNTRVDSLVILWPSGATDRYTEIQADQHYLAVENSCCKVLPDAHYESDRLDCVQTQIVALSGNGEAVQWSTGITAPEIVITDEGYYAAQFLASVNCSLPLQSVYIDTLPRPNTTPLNLEDSLSICTSKALRLESREDTNTLWSSGEEGAFIDIINDGNYFALNSNRCDTVYSDTVNVRILDPTAFGRGRDTLIEEPDVLLLNGEGGSTNWYADPGGKDTIGSGMDVLTDTLYSDTIFYFDTKLEQTAPQYIAGPPLDLLIGKLKENTLPINHTLQFEVHSSCIFKSADCYAFSPGMRVIEIFSENNLLVYRDTFQLDGGRNRIDMDVQLDPGNYRLQTNESVNFEVFQKPGPQLGILDAGFRFPFTIDNLLTIRSGLLGIAFYPYFFEWRLEPIIEECRSPIVEFSVNLLETGIEEKEHNHAYSIHPNPAESHLYMGDGLIGSKLEIVDLSGIKRYETVLEGNQTLDIAHLKNGLYILRCEKDGKMHTFKFLKM